MTTTSLDHLHGTARLRALGVVAAMIAPLAVWAVTVPLLGVDLRVATTTGVQAVGPAMIVVFTLVVSLLGWALLAVLERLTRRAATLWLAVAAVLLLLSLVPPVTGALTAGGAVTLVLMHLVVAAVLVPAMRRSARR